MKTYSKKTEETLITLHISGGGGNRRRAALLEANLIFEDEIETEE